MKWQFSQNLHYITVVTVGLSKNLFTSKLLRNVYISELVASRLWNSRIRLQYVVQCCICLVLVYLIMSSIL
jgi:hypothetical protein